jgi:hypothetical protein
MDCYRRLISSSNSKPSRHTRRKDRPRDIQPMELAIGLGGTVDWSPVDRTNHVVGVQAPFVRGAAYSNVQGEGALQIGSTR